MKPMTVRWTVNRAVRRGLQLLRGTFSGSPSQQMGEGKQALEIQKTEGEETEVADDLIRNDASIGVMGTPYYGRRFNLYSMFGLIFILVTWLASYLRDYRGADVPQCRPIYMYPSYARIDGFTTDFTPLAQKYHLYLYREQGMDKEPLENGEIQLDGVPVLFIPGNAGSFKQARSIAARCAELYFGSRGSIQSDVTRNIDLFTADFNEDFTAFHGQTMLDQAEYLNDAIGYILSLYEKSNSYGGMALPRSVMIVAHSMGGTVARVMPLLQNHIPGSVNTIITLSTPHAIAPVTFDGDILKIYREVNDFWREQFSDPDSFFSKNVTLISITGGLSDTILPADYATAKYVVHPDNGFTVFTTTIPGVWTTIDHLAIVWCSQLRDVLAKLILEMIDSSNHSKTKSVEERMRLARLALLSGFEEYDIVRSPLGNPAGHLEPIGSILEVLNSNEAISDTLYVFNRSNVQNIPEQTMLFKVPENMDDGVQFTVLSSGDIPGVALCKDNSLQECISLHDNTLVIPNLSELSTYASDGVVRAELRPASLLNIPKEYLADYKYILVDKISSDIFQKDDDFFAASLTSSKFEYTFNDSAFDTFLRGIRIPLASENKISFYNITFPNLWDSLVSYSVQVKVSDNLQPRDLLFQPIIRQWIEEPFETKWHVNIIKNGVFDINMHNVAPYVPVSDIGSNPLHLSAIMPPNSQLDLEISINWPLTIKSLFIRYRLAIGAIPIFFIALVIAYQFYFYSKSETYMSFSRALTEILSKFGGWITLGFLLLTPIVNLRLVEKILQLLDPVGLNRPFLLSQWKIRGNFYYLGIRGLFSSWIGVFFEFMSIGLLFVICRAIDVLEVGIGKISQKIFKNTLNLDNVRGKKLLDAKRLVTCIGLCLAVIFYFPYQLAFVIISIVQIGTCIRIALYKNEKSKEYMNLRNYNISLLILFLLLIVINGPVLVVFLHNLAIRYETTFRSHHNFISVAPIILLVATNSTLNMPYYSMKSFDYYVIIGLFSYLAFFSLIYGVRNLFFIHDIVNIICGWLLYGSVIRYLRSPS